ncbi:ABC transporter substrate-binding protein [Streptomyces sp. NPDC088194]|uniref:sugar ABC transporter substrate-binding protein n=1 Tax=Streptomyces sp. NPDC088194 TaxID=3154931 RepID=UPI00344C5DF6
MGTETLLTRRSLLGLIGSATGAALVGACAPSSSGSTHGDAQATGFGFTGWSLNEASSKDALNSLLATWAGNNHVKLRKTAFPYDNYLSQFTLQARGGELSGAAQMDIAWLGQAAALGRLVDLGTPAAQGGYTPAALTSGKADGVQYGLPWTTASIGLIANQDMLDQVGAKALPATIDDFEALLTELKATGVTPYAGSTKVTQLKDIEPWIWTFGGSIIADGKVTLGDDGSVEAVTWYKKLYDKKLIAPDVDRFDARALFAQKKAAIYDDAISGRGAVAAASSDKELAKKLTPVPRPVVHAGDTPQAMLWGHVLVVFKGTGSDRATQLASWLTTDQAALTTWFEKTSYPPATTAGLARPDVAKDTYTSRWSSLITKTARPGPFWGYPKGAQMDTALATQVQAALTGQASPKHAMQQAASDIKALMSS